MKKRSKRKPGLRNMFHVPLQETPFSRSELRGGRGRAKPPSVPAGRTLWICALLAILTAVAYSGVGSFGFVNLDDDAYVEFQPMVNQGLRPAAVVWAFTATHSNNWHPLTSLSHMLDCSLFGNDPGPMHQVNVLWHILNTLLVFLVWQAATGATWRSAFVAGLFALHPAHVESVAWIAERKDVLSTFFCLLAMGAYVRYARNPSAKRYFLVAFFFVFGLLSKPMVVTLPATLLLLDFWPLRRWPAADWKKLAIEKLPLFALAGILAAVTIAVQVSTGASNYGTRFPLLERAANALVSVIRYVAEGILPSPLAPHYDHPGWWPWWAVAGSAAAILLVTAWAFCQRKALPWLLFGWGWFLVTLLPVIGIIQVGAQAMADRYTYVPFLGLFTAAVWVAGEAVQRFPRIRVPAAGFGLATLLLFGFVTRQQAPAWKDSLTLYQHSIAAGVDNATIRYLYAVALRSAGKPEEAVAAQFRRATELAPDYTNAYTQLAILSINREDFAEAERLIQKTIFLEPRNPALLKNDGVLLNLQGRPEEAVARLQDALKLDPSYIDAHRELSRIYLAQNNPAAALREIERVADASPWDFSVHGELAGLYQHLGRTDDARRCLERAKWINPRY